MRIAVTGGVAEGKSTVLGYLREMGYRTASSDEIAREVLQLPEVQQELSRRYELPEPVTPEALRRRVWDNADARRLLNQVTHPLILERLCALESGFIEIPLLIETCLQGYFDAVWVVTCGQKEQRNRLLTRLRDPQRVESVLRTQLPSELKVAFADIVVRTNAEPEYVQRFIADAVR